MAQVCRPLTHLLATAACQGHREEASDGPLVLPLTTQARAEAMLALSTEQGFVQWLAYGAVFRGWSRTEQGQSREGITQMHQGLAAWRTTGAEMGRPYFLGLLAEAYGKGGQAAEGLTTLDEALAAMEKTEERFSEAELYRLKGELLLAATNAAAAAACFHQALDIARRQQAKSLELRAAVSLSRLWRPQGKQAEAYEVLAPIYGWCTEGFDIADLQDAKALLEALV
jgi:predicted ATPase